jgi:hypothetical protein
MIVGETSVGEIIVGEMIVGEMNQTLFFVLLSLKYDY